MSEYVRADTENTRTDGQLLRHKTDPRRWLVRAFVGRNANGRKRYASKVVHGGKRDAMKALAELQQSKHQGTLAPRSTAKLADLVKEWLAHKATQVSPRTLEGYRHVLEAYVLPTLGHRKLTSLDLREIDHLYQQMLEGNIPKPAEGETGWSGKPLSTRTVRLAHTALRQALSQAVKWRMLQHNPASEATAPQNKTKEQRALTMAEREKFIAASRSSFYGPFYRLLVDTGLRPGEACGLRWGDVDLEHGRIAVQRTVTMGDDGPELAEPKTAQSRRTVPLVTSVWDDLLAHFDWQREHSLDEAGFVFTTLDGRMLVPANFNRRDWSRVVRAAGISDPDSVTLYSLRHTFGTMHVRNRTPLKVVSELMGHASIQQTADIYQHVSVDATETWMHRFEESLAPKKERSGAAAN